MERKLSDMLADAGVVERRGPEEQNIASVGFDSRTVTPGQLFVALRGTQSDGHAFIPGAVASGAVAIVCEQWPEEIAPQVTYLRVEDSHAALGRIASGFYDHPSRKLRLVGVTGTNGKTTTATLLYDLYRELGYKAGLISTVTYAVDGRETPSTHTTPDPVRLNALLAEMADCGCGFCFMEVSSHSIVQRRIEGLAFAGGVFTNITHDHLDYHKTFAEYIRAKKAFFDALPQEAFALVNGDDRNGGVMVQNTRAAVRTFALKSFADFRGRVVETVPEGMLLNLDGSEVWVRFLGGFNAYNLLGVYACARLLGSDRDEVLRVLSRLESVRGRFETVYSKTGVTAVIDYAHTPDALANVLKTVAGICPRGKKIYTVVGCGGNRDRTKRPVMARIAVENSHLAILTSDNPRFEKPEGILQEMEAGLPPDARTLVIADRREAIKTAAMLAAPGDVVLVAGKGHETYQDVAGTKHHFDDREEVRRAFGLE